MAKKKKEEFNQMQYVNLFIKEHYDRIVLLAKAGEKDKLKKIAKQAGQSMSEYGIQAIEERMKRDNGTFRATQDERSTYMENHNISMAYEDIISKIMLAKAENMPFIPVADWLELFKPLELSKEYTETQNRRIEELKEKAISLAYMLGYTLEDDNGYLLKK